MYNSITMALYNIFIRGDTLNKEKSIRYILNTAAFLCFIVALVLSVLLRVFRHEMFLEWYSKYTDTLLSVELWMQTYGASIISVIFILLNYTVKCAIPWLPISCIIVGVGVIFEWYYAILIDVIGLFILFTIKFVWGRRFGGGNAGKIIGLFDNVHEFIDKNEIGSPLVLFILRLIPGVTVNAVSQLYGSTGLSYPKFMIVSLVGYAYKIVSYTVIGRNVFDPASADFIVPLMIFSVISGLILLAVSGLLKIKMIKKYEERGRL